jgi:nucleoside-diphosphate-sugar epimerase
MSLDRTSSEVGYKPEYGVDNGIADYIDWLKTHPQ